MNKYKVVVEYKTHFMKEVEAENEEAACKAAFENWTERLPNDGVIDVSKECWEAPMVYWQLPGTTRMVSAVVPREPKRWCSPFSGRCY